MILLGVLMVWYGRKFGLNYFGWLIGYIALAVTSFFVSLDGPQGFILPGLCILYLLIYFTAPLLATREDVARMQENKEKYKKEEEELDENVRKKFEGWEVIKFYTDASDGAIYKSDKELLEGNKIKSNAKSLLGITTLSVMVEDSQRAMVLLGIIPATTEASVSSDADKL